MIRPILSESELINRRAIAEHILTPHLQEAAAIKSFSSHYEDMASAVTAIRQTRRMILPFFKSGRYLNEENIQNGVNCIARSMATCALALLVEQPVVDPVFLLQHTISSTLVADRHREDEDEVYVIDYSCSTDDSLLTTAVEERVHLYGLHRRPGSRMFCNQIFDDASDGAEVVVLPYGDPDVTTELGLPADIDSNREVIFSASGVSLATLDSALKNWYRLKRLYGGPIAATKLSNEHKRSLPFRV